MKTTSNTAIKNLLILLCLTTLPSQAQSWQWGKSGGTTDSFNTLTEQVKSACTDIYGNVYLVSDVGSANSQVDGVPKQSYNNGFGLRDGILASFSCTGAYRWSKVIGGGLTDYLNSVQSDTMGNIYVLGQVAPVSNNPLDVPVHFDTDVTLPVSPYDENTFKQSVFIIKYNSEGVFQWLRMPQPADVSFAQTLTSTNAQDLQVDAQGNSYSLCHLPVGVYADGAYTVTVSGFNILKYDTNGVFLGGVPIDIQFENPRVPARMRRNHQTGDFYVTGFAFQDEFAETITINGALQTKAIFIAAFNSAGNFLWKRENNNTSMFNDFPPSIGIDIQNNVYLSTAAGPINQGNGNYEVDSFNGTNIGTLSFQTPIPFIVKMDANGNNLWLTSGTKTRPMDLVLHGDEIVTCGSITNTTWQNLSFLSPTLSQHAYIARFNKNTGSIISIDPLGTNSADLGVALATDSKGNYYLGGRFGSMLTAGVSTLVKNGGAEDFFIAKFGSNDCDFLANQEFEPQQLQGYPNPVKGIFKLNNPEAGTYRLYDLLGHQVRSGVVSAYGDIDLSALPSGMYFLQLQNTNGENQVLKLVKE